MSDNDSRRKSNSIEVLKAISTFISSIIIAGAGVFVTSEYNNKQLDISRNRELAILIPKLGDADANVRKFGAISLALYGKGAVPALMAVLNDADPAVRGAGSESLALIGGEALFSDLKKVHKDRRNSDGLRGTALYTLGLMKDPEEAYNLAVSALRDPSEGHDVLWDAVSVLWHVKKKEGSKELVEVLPRSQKLGSDLMRHILQTLSYVEDQGNMNTVIGLLGHANEEVRFQTAKFLGESGQGDALDALSKTVSSDKNEKVRKAAAQAITQIKQRYPK